MELRTCVADVFVRLVESPGVPGYRPLTTFGWNAFEIIVDDVFRLAKEIRSAPFEVIGEPLRELPRVAVGLPDEH